MAISDAQALLNQTSFKQVTFTPKSTVKTFRSPHNRARQKQVNPFAEWWEVDIQLVAGTPATHREWTGYLAGLNSSEHTVLFGDASATTTLGTASGDSGVPLVNGAHAIGDKVLNVDGVPISAPLYLQRGDWIQLGAAATSRLYKVTADVASNGAGEIAIDIWPSLKAVPSDNDPLTINSCQGVFELEENSSVPWTVGGGGVISAISFKLVEVN